ncbi:MAG TPA: hypothetical protein VIF10_01215 [Methylobacter sp.]|jgi:hypothetical protein
MQTQTQTSGFKTKRGGGQPRAGRPIGSKGPTTVKKTARKFLEQVMLDENAPYEARVTAACKLIDQVQP